MTTVVTAIAVFWLAALLYSEKKEILAGRIVFKLLLSTLFVVVAMQQKGSTAGYANAMLAGLILSWVGDLCLIFESPKIFLGGLIAFFATHVCYAVAFFSHGTLGLITFSGLAVLLGIGLIIYSWLRPNLGQMRVPVIGYMIVITVMLGGALTVMSTPTIAADGKALVMTGAVLFYLSDILVARDKFVARGFVNRAVGLPPYFLAQFLFAFSIGAL